MRVAYLMIRDGRDQVHDRSLASARAMLPDPDEVVLIDDAEHALGFAGAIDSGWRQIQAARCDYVFHLELDFVFLEPVALHQMIAVLHRNPHLVQLVLKRQPWNDQERAAGGIVEQHPSDFTERTDGVSVWTEHRRFFSTNPSVYRAGLCHRAWPQVPESEGMFTHELLADPETRFAFWGAKHDPPRVEHIGHERAGRGY